MAVFTIAGLTVREAARRKTLLGSFLLGLLTFAISLLLFILHQHMMHLVNTGRWTEQQVAIQYPIAIGAVASLCISAIKVLGAIFGAILAGGAISGELDRGLLAVILPRPFPRWQLVLGKWVGINLILCGSVLTWTVMDWASLTYQSHQNLTPILQAGLALTLFPALISTIALTFSTVAPRLFGTILALLVGGIAWFDGFLNALGKMFHVQLLHNLAVVAGLLLPQSYVGYWVEAETDKLDFVSSFGRTKLWQSPRFLTEWGAAHLHFPRLDALYVAAYILGALLLGMVLFQRRDI